MAEKTGAQWQQGEELGLAVLSHIRADLALGRGSMDLLPVQSQFSFSKACHRKRARMLFLSLRDTKEESQVGNSDIIL